MPVPAMVEPVVDHQRRFQAAVEVIQNLPKDGMYSHHIYIFTYTMWLNLHFLTITPQSNYCSMTHLQLLLRFMMCCLMQGVCKTKISTRTSSILLLYQLTIPLIFYHLSKQDFEFCISAYYYFLQVKLCHICQTFCTVCIVAVKMRKTNTFKVNNI